MDILKKLYEINIFYLLVEGGLNLTLNFMRHKVFKEFYHFKSNMKLNRNGVINLSNIDKIAKNQFKDFEEINSFTESDKVLRYY